jgi:ring-1,2-phenylacetyl-CoA epoxidase subunit PaaC
MKAAKPLLLALADDALIHGHRMSEWTGLGPILEEDIAFSSIAQDQIGHALAIYTILHEEFGEAEPDALGFARTENEFTSCHLVELPNQGFDFSIARQFLYDHAAWIHFESAENSSYTSLARLARKIKGELKYHLLHANTWMVRLGSATEESHWRMQQAINELFPYALSLFEPLSNETELAEQKIYGGEKALQEAWLNKISSLLQTSGLKLPEIQSEKVHYGGRAGYHTTHLQPLLMEMNAVLTTETGTEW